MFIRILNSEMELATGCTEPGAVALTAAEAGCALRRAGANTVEEVLVSASVNIIKNAMSAGIPGTSYEGMDYAAAIGAVGGDPVHLLEVMNYVAPEQVEQAAALVKAGKVEVEVAQVPQKLYVDVTVKGEGHTGRAVVRDLHTNVVLVQQDGETTLDKTNAAAQSPDGRDLVPPEEIAAFLTVKSIWDYCTEELDPLHDPIDIIRSAVKVNTAISEEGLSMVPNSSRWTNCGSASNTSTSTLHKKNQKWAVPTGTAHFFIAIFKNSAYRNGIFAICSLRMLLVH